MKQMSTGSTFIESLVAAFALFAATVTGAVFGAGLMYLATVKNWLQ